VLDRIAEFFINTLYPASTGDLAIDFGDSSLKPDSAATMRLLAVLGFSPELTRWYLGRSDPDSINPLSLLYLEGTQATARNSLATSVIYPTIGWATMRISWDNDATLLGIKSGFTWNHAHADAGSFVLYHAGQPLLIDSGRCSYSRKEYLDYYCQSQAHNIVLFNGQGQPFEDFHARGVKFSGHVHDLLDGMGVKYVYADATGPMARYFRRNYRHWLWIDGVNLVIDEILAFEEGRFDWLLHYAGEARASDATVELSNGAARASLKMLHPSNPVISEEIGLAADAPDKKVKYLRLSTPANAREQKFIVAIVLQTNDITASSPNVELLQETNALGARITSKDKITDVYLNLMADGRRMHANSNNTIRGWETDAYLLAMTRPAGAPADIENATRYFVVGCSYLRRNGQSALDSLSKVTAIFQPGENIEVLLHGQRHSASDAIDRFGGRAEALTPPLRRAREFLHAHADEPLDLAQLAEAAGTGIRALQLGFQRHFGTSISEMLRDIRLAHLNIRLAASSSDDSITDIAFELGFTHLSRMASAYRAKFGETPSATLRGMN